MKQSKALFLYNVKKIGFLFIIVVLLAVSSIITLNSNQLELLTLYSGVFNRYLFCFAIFPLQIASVLALGKINLNYVTVTKTKSVIAYQAVYNIIFIILLSYFCWLFALGVTIFLTPYRTVLLENQAYLLFLSGVLKLMATSAFFMLLTLIVFFLLNNQVIAQILGFAVVFLLFALDVSHYFSLFFMFAVPQDILAAIGNILIITGVNFLLVALLNYLITIKEFL